MLSGSDILSVTHHRPWKLPSGPWVMTQGWYDLLFAHWPIKADILRPLVPDSLTVDTFAGTAWLSITPFDLHLRPRALPVVSHFPELNCRTYVIYQDKPGIYFFSLDAGNHLAVFGARGFFLLPYHYSIMTARKENGGIFYSSRRTRETATFVAKYHPVGAVRLTSAGTLEHWLTERYCLYTQRRNWLFRGEIHHLPWPLQDATCELQENTTALASGVALPEIRPLCHFAKELDALIWPLRGAK